MNQYSKILIIGGTGTLGQPTAQLLSNSGYQVRIMTRNPNKVMHLRSSKVEIVQGDLIDAKSIASACSGMEVVIAMAHSLLGVGKYASRKVDFEGSKSLIDAAKAEGIKKFIYLSILGVGANHEVDFWKTKYEVEQYLQQSGLNYTIIRSAAYMETHLQLLLGKGIMEKGKATIFGNGDNPTNFVSVLDIAPLIKIVIENPAPQNSIIEIGGPDNISKNDVATLYFKRINRPVKVTHLSPRFLRIMSKIVKPFHSGISRVMLLSAIVDESDQTFDVSDTQQKFQLTLISVEDFVNQQKY